MISYQVNENFVNIPYYRLPPIPKLTVENNYKFKAEYLDPRANDKIDDVWVWNRGTNIDTGTASNSFYNYWLEWVKLISKKYNIDIFKEPWESGTDLINKTIFPLTISIFVRPFVFNDFINELNNKRGSKSITESPKQFSLKPYRQKKEDEKLISIYYEGTIKYILDGYEHKEETLIIE